jgi:hypothetical protein
MKKLLGLLAFVVISCSTPENVEEANKTTVAQPAVAQPVVLHIPSWMQGQFYRANALGGAPQSTGYRMYITSTSIRTEFDQTITSPFAPPVYNLIKESYTDDLHKYYSNFKELYGTDNVGEFYKVYGDDLFSTRKNVLIYHFWRNPAVLNTFCFRYPNNWEYWVKF